MHDPVPERRDFDGNVAGSEWGMPMHGYFSPDDVPTLANGPMGASLTDRLTDGAIDLIESHD